MKRFALAVLLISLCLSGMATADPIDPFNSRPVTVNPGPETPLQTILNTIYGPGVMNVSTDQQNAGMWTIGAPLNGFLPILRFEFAGNANTNIFGIWSATDTTATPTLVPIFTGPASPTTPASIFWSDANTIVVSGGAGVTNGTFAGIPFNFFGFYLQTASGATFFTADQMNGGLAQAVGYRRASDDRWTIAFEDIGLRSGSDADYNDLVVTAESITPVPEPSSIALFGTGLLAAASAIRRKFHLR